MLGIALGCIGMSRDDFERCTPFEFYEVWSRWGLQHRDNERGAWERVRVMALFFIQPYVKSKLTAHDILPLPWDEEESSGKAEEISKEEFKRRFEEAKRRNGLK